MQGQQAIRIITYVCRTIQVHIALISLAITASLLPTFTSLRSDCVTELAGIECRRLGQTVGGLRFSLATTALAIVDVSLGIFALRQPLVPGWVVATLDSVTAGFYLGSGSTIAARLNGELCAAGPSDPEFACGRLFADMGFMFVGAMSCYALVACFWTGRARECQEERVETEREGHALENPFRDPPTSEPAEGQDTGRGLSKRKSWSDRA